MTELPPELKKVLEAEMYKEPYGEMVIEMNDVVRVVASFLEKNKFDLVNWKNVKDWIDSGMQKPAGIQFTAGVDRNVAWLIEVGVEAEKERQKAFLEAKKKELKEMLMDTSYHQLSIRGKSRPDLMKREAAVRFVVAVFGGERK